MLAQVLRRQIVDAAEEIDIHHVGKFDREGVGRKIQRINHLIPQPLDQSVLSIRFHVLREPEREAVGTVFPVQAEGFCRHVGIEADEVIAPPILVIPLLQIGRLRIEHELVFRAELVDRIARQLDPASGDLILLDVCMSS